LLYSGGATCYPASGHRKRHVQIRRCGPLMRSLCRAKEKHIKLLLTRLVVVQSDTVAPLGSGDRFATNPVVPGSSESAASFS
jgi:hypothetical protein